MVVIQNEELLKKFVEMHNFQDLFSTQDLPFQLCRYDVGELMNVSHPQEDYLKFLVQGKVAVDKVNDDGTLQRLFEEEAFAFFGEAEICGHRLSSHYHEVIETVYSIELPVQPLRDVLWNDLKFMQYLVRRMSDSIYLATEMIEDLTNDVEARLLYYITHNCENNTFSGMELTAKRIRCSSRQLYRVVRKMVNEGRLVNTGWGTYTIR